MYKIMCMYINGLSSYPKAVDMFVCLKQLQSHTDRCWCLEWRGMTPGNDDGDAT